MYLESKRLNRLSGRCNLFLPWVECALKSLIIFLSRERVKKKCFIKTLLPLEIHKGKIFMAEENNSTSLIFVHYWKILPHQLVTPFF